MRSLKTALHLLFLASAAMSVVGCGEKNPNVNVPADKVAPKPEDVANTPGYREQMGGQK